ncbi:hypothetical protein [Streptomyces sp. MNU76]|uniref:hypothetical protein n=1 Tax=Streptomyces sp. MNU76 TaxID=2560026 RepID=UPI0027DF7F0E|nr:hypothetical protein [Streptomyces sp. MNU76]
MADGGEEVGCGGVGEQVLDCAVEALGFIVGVLGEGPVEGHLEEEAEWLSRAVGGGLEASVCGGWEGEVEEDLAVRVGVVGGDHVDGEQFAGLVAQSVEGLAWGFGGYQGHEVGGVVVGCERRCAGGLVEFGWGEGPGQGDVQGVVRHRHAFPWWPGAVWGRRVWMCAAWRRGSKTCHPVRARSAAPGLVAWSGQRWVRQRICSVYGRRLRS